MCPKWKSAILVPAVLLAAGWVGSSPAQAQHNFMGHLFQHHHCPPPFVHCQEGPPNIKYKHACPRPVCNPCDLPHYGYFQPCWRPWPFPPDWSHCPEVPPAALIHPGLPLLAQMPETGPAPKSPTPMPGGAEQLPPPGTEPLPPPSKLSVVPKAYH